MTTVALVAGLMPLALGIEEGSETYKGMAAVIIGGMLSSTLLSLLVVPCMYTYFDDLQRVIGWRSGTGGRSAAQEGGAAPPPAARRPAQPVPAPGRRGRAAPAAGRAWAAGGESVRQAIGQYGRPESVR